MKPDMKSRRCGYTIVELMVSLVVVTVLAGTIGMFVVKLLTIREREREDAYIREKLTNICAAYADFMSIGSSFSTNGQEIVVMYRQETGGVSLETGIVSQVTSLVTVLNTNNWAMDSFAYGLESGSNVLKLVRNANGNAPLIPLVGDIVSCTITPIRDALNQNLEALGNLRVEARYQAKNEKGELETKTTSVERMVRFWNRN